MNKLADRYYPYALLILLAFSSCNQDQKNGEGLENPEIQEASGLAASIKNPGCYWTHNDSRDKARIFLIDSLGRGKAELSFPNLKNRDWEDIAVGPGPIDSLSYIYIAEIGDNYERYTYKTIYRLIEPTITLDSQTSINDVGIITFQYADGNRDAETLMIDPLSKDLFIVSKRESDVHLYRLPYPQTLTDTFLLEKEITLPFTEITGGDITHDGSKILIKNYDSVFYWSRNEHENIVQALSREAQVLDYIKENQGEGIAWSIDGKSYYTLSEARDGILPHLNHYLFKLKTFDRF